MAMTMTQKILAKGARKDDVKPGQLIQVKVDMVLGNDITAPVAIREFEKTGIDKVFDTKKIALVPDHFTPNKDIKSAEQVKMMREFARRMGIVHFFEVGQMGVEHALLPEQGLVVAGDIVIGADSHTCTYGALGAFSTGVGSTDMAAAMATGEVWLKVPEAIRFHLIGKPSDWVGGKDIILHIIGKIGVDGALYKSMEFTGEGLEFLSMDDRFTMANMAIEAGAKNGIFEVDTETLKYVREHSDKNYFIYKADRDAEYIREVTIDLGQIRPTVSFPHLPDNTRSIDEVGDVPIHQVVIGSCTNGRMEDMRIAAKIMAGKKVHSGVRCIIIPATQRIWKQCMQEGLFNVFIDSGCAISTPTCGPCLGGHMGILAEGERAVSTTNRNFVGRMGHIRSEVYLAGPAVAAASAITGKISAPESVME